MKHLLLAAVFATASFGSLHSSAASQELAKKIEEATLFNAGFLEVTDNGIDVKKTSWDEFDRISVVRDGLFYFAKELNYVFGYPKKELYVQKGADKKTQLILEATNYNGERYAKIWQFGTDNKLKAMSSCYLSHDCISVNKAICADSEAAPLENDPEVLNITRLYAPLFYSRNEREGKETDVKIARSFCEFIK